MESKNIFQPNKNKILMTLVLYLIIGAGTWVPILSQIFATGFKFISNMNLQIVEIMFSLVASYLISCYFVTYFKKEELKDLPLGVQVISFYLLYRLLGAVFVILKNLIPNSYSNFLAEASMRFGGNFPLTIALMMASLVFLIIKFDKKYLLGSIYFLFMLINPYDLTGNLIFSPAFQGPVYGNLINVILSLTQGDLVSIYFGLMGALFPTTILGYLYMKSKNKIKTENTAVVIIILAYYTPRLVSLFL